MVKRLLTDAFVNSTQCEPKGGRRRAEYWDSREPCLVFRVSSTGHRSYSVTTRYPHHDQPTCRSINQLLGPPRDVAHAREICRDWLRMIKAGLDPQAEHHKQVAAQLRVKKFGEVMEAWIAHKVEDKQATTEHTRQLFAREIPKGWMNRPIGDIRQEDITAVIRNITSRGTNPTAHMMLGGLRAMFRWAIGTGEYGLEKSPVEAVSPKKLIGRKVTRDRVLKDDELIAVWKAADSLGYIVGDIVKLLALTGQRKSDIARLSWSEIDFDKALITIPAARMKAKRAHEIPLAPMALSILRNIKQQRGPYVFSSTNGHRPFTGFSRAKDTMDELSKVEAWVFHDLRRTFRTKIAAYKISETAKELTIAHAQQGLHAVYDQHSYRSEKLEIFQMWERELSNLINPPAQTNVVSIPRRPLPKPVSTKIARRPLPKQPAPQRTRLPA